MLDSRSMFKRFFALLSFVIAVASISATALAKQPTLTIGSLAPALRPSAWLKGTPVKSFLRGHFYVVEFWATWCEPCKENIPHLTELAKKFKGKVTFVGVDIWESDDPTIVTLPKVKAFVKSEGSKMGYVVAADGPHNQVANAWMKAAGEGGIPTAFVIDGKGIVDWIGGPQDLEPVLKQVLAGTFNVQAAKELRERSKGPIFLIQDQLKLKEYKQALASINAEIKKKPDSARSLDILRLTALTHVDFREFKKDAKKILDESKGNIGMYQMLCSIFASETGLPKSEFEYGLKLDEEALKNPQGRDYLFLAMGAAMDSSLGNLKEAILLQQQSVDAGSKSPHCPQAFLEFLQKGLAKYQAEEKKQLKQ